MRMHHIWKLATLCAIALVSLSGMTGCTPKGSTGSGSGGTGGGGGGDAGDQPTLVSLEASDGICPDSNGLFPTFNNTYENVYTNSPALVPNADPSCDIASEPLKLLGHLQIQLRINTANAAIDHYDWEISPDLRGGFDPNFTTTNSPYIARTPANTIAYITPRMTDLYALDDLPNGVFNVTLSATAFTSQGRFTAGFFNLTFLWPDATQVSASTGGAEVSHADPTHIADFYYIQAAGAVTIVAVSETNAAGVALGPITLRLYNDQLQQTFVDDGAASGFSGFSRVNANLTAHRSFYVEVEQPASASYYLLVAADQTATNPATVVQKTLKIPSPWDGRTYSGRVTELDSAAQPAPMILDGDFDYPYADYYIVAGCGCITTITGSFSRPNDIYTPDPPVGGEAGGIVRVYDSSLNPVSPLPDTQNQYGLGAPDIYYVEVAALSSRIDQWAHPLGTTYTITAGSTTMVPTTTPFP